MNDHRVGHRGRHADTVTERRHRPAEYVLGACFGQIDGGLRRDFLHPVRRLRHSHNRQRRAGRRTALALLGWRPLLQMRVLCGHPEVGWPGGIAPPGSRRSVPCATELISRARLPMVCQVRRCSRQRRTSALRYGIRHGDVMRGAADSRSGHGPGPSAPEHRPAGSRYSSGQPSNEFHSFLQSRSTSGSSSLVSAGNGCALTREAIEPRGNATPMWLERDRITSSGW
jgi:hypothetical protein